MIEAGKGSVMFATYRSGFHRFGLTAFLLFLPIMPALAQESDMELLPGQSRDITGVTVIGSVKQPVSLVWHPGLRPLEVLAECGGPSLSPENAKAVVLTRDGKTRIEINLSALLDGNDQRQNLPLWSGDLVLIEPKDVAEVYVSGAALHSGTYPVTKLGITPSDLLAGMGGPTAEAALSHAQIIHGIQIQICDLRRVPSSPAQNYRLFPGDLLLIPSVDTVKVQGAVLQPGHYCIPDGETLTVGHVLALAHPSSDADIDRAIVVRYRDHKQIENIRARLKDELLPGDTLVVPRDTRTGKVRPWLIAGAAEGVTP